MKTAVIWNEFEVIKYLVMDGDLTRFQDIYINSVDDNEELQNDLSAIVYNQKTWEFEPEEVEIGVFAAAIRDGALVVECGFIP